MYEQKARKGDQSEREELKEILSNSACSLSFNTASLSDSHHA